MIHHYMTKQFLGFAFVGGLAAFLHWMARIVLSYWLAFPYAVAIAYFVGMGVAFLLNSVFVFPGSIKRRYKQLRDFIIVNVIFFPVVWGVTIVFEKILQSILTKEYSQAISHAIAVLIPPVITFLAYKLFVFKEADYG